MTTVHVGAEVLERAGLPAAEAAAWAASPPDPRGSFDAAADAVSRFLSTGQAFITRLPGPARRSADEQAARDAIAGTMDGARESFLRLHAEGLYDALTGCCSRSLRLAELLAAAAARVPGLVPTSAELDAERARTLPEKDGIEFAQGLLVAHVLAVPQAGRHLVGAMLCPTSEALERLGELRATGTVDLGPVRVTRRGRAGILELSNPRHLNAEDDVTLGPTECGVDMILLDPEIEVGVIRGGVVDHPRYQGTRVFGSGINLTRLYNGRIDFLFYLVRDLGYVNKIYRGITLPAQDTGRPELFRNGHEAPAEGTVEKLWIGAVERFAVGGACQLLHVVDYVIATRGSRLFLPARNEGIIPGASNLRLPRFVGDRAARQAILSGREWTAGEPDAALLCDEVVEPGDIDRAVEARIEALTNSGLVNAAANRCTLRAGQEPLDLFREYMATFAVEQARCHLSPALVRNLEVHWNARGRSA
ncbi:MAG TPA: enoyl-CoA hydratase/isomerase family protein [Streptosporangiaceae bacterium]|nr:enoyl-CoA hydratase/isomerase family protein [Streptosporangiaceae bacterium]